MIPARPWRAIHGEDIVTQDGKQHVASTSDLEKRDGSREETAELIVRLVNAQTEIVAALEAAELTLYDMARALGDPNPEKGAAYQLVSAALKKMQGATDV